VEREGSFIKIAPRNKGPYLKIRKRTVYIPLMFMKHFSCKYVELLFDPKQNLIALRPTEDPFNFKLVNRSSKISNAIICQRFLKYYKINPQDLEVKWDSKRKILIGRVQRDPETPCE